MQLSALPLPLALLAASFLTACDPVGRVVSDRPPPVVVFDPAAVPAPPSYSGAFKRELAAEIERAPKSALIVSALTDASIYYDRIRRLKNLKAD